MGVTEAIIISSLIAAGTTVAISELNKQDSPDVPEPPDESKLAIEAKQRRRESQGRFNQRSSALGPIQLQAPGLKPPRRQF